MLLTELCTFIFFFIYLFYLFAHKSGWKFGLNPTVGDHGLLIIMIKFRRQNGYKSGLNAFSMFLKTNLVKPRVP